MTRLFNGHKGLILLLLFVSVGCTNAETVVVVEKEVDPLPGAREKATCSSVTSYSGGVTITGSAIFKRLSFGANGLTSTVDSTDYPIRFAEVEVRNSGGSRIQCGSTASDGTFSIIVPQNASTTYTLYVNSRADNSSVKVSVQNNPDNYQYYSISQSFTPDSSKSIGTLTASASGDTLGGAFNIYDRIVRANEFLREKTLNCSATYTGCEPFTVAPKVFAYWTKGFNPATYFGSSSGLSFYLPGRSQLFILGGASGDVASSDTDHFDDVVILHEYGHFIEDIYADTDSPGGTHDADSIIDSRLAWGEGWATFMAIAILGDPVYRDTVGYGAGGMNPFRNYNLETGLDSTTSTRDTSTYLGEGNFREFAVTRALWDIIDPYVFDSTTYSSTDSDTVNGDFDELWTVFAGSSYLKNSSNHFRDFGLFMSLHAGVSGTTVVSSVLSDEDQRASRQDYASEDTTPGGTCAATSIQPYNITGDGTDDSLNPINAEQFSANDFYKITHSGGTFNLSLSYTSGSPAADLDLYVYKDGYTFGDSSDIVGTSNATSDGGSEVISKSLAAGVYLANINVYANGGSVAASQYTLTYNGEQVCP